VEAIIYISNMQGAMWELEAYSPAVIVEWQRDQGSQKSLLRDPFCCYKSSVFTRGLPQQLF
jgi:hypothetical protein